MSENERKLAGSPRAIAFARGRVYPRFGAPDEAEHSDVGMVAWAFLSISSERRGTAITDPQALGYALLHTTGDRRPVVNRVEKVLRIARQRIVDVEVEKVAMRAGGYEPGQRPLAGCKPRRFASSGPWNVAREERRHDQDDWDVRHVGDEAGKLFNCGKLRLGNGRSVRRFVRRRCGPEFAVAE